MKPPDPPAKIITAAPQNTRNHEEAKRKLETEIELERRKLQSEQERLKREADALQEERKKLEEEKLLLRSTINKSSAINSKSVGNLNEIDKKNDKTPVQIVKNNTPTSPSSGSNKSNSSNGSGSLAAALQLEIKRRKQKAAAVPSLSEASSGTSAATKKSPFITDKNEKHDMLIAEFKKAHKKMFTSSTEASEEDVKNIKQKKDVVIVEDTRPKAPPPPPIRTSTMYTPSSSSSESLSPPASADRTNTLLTVVNTPSSVRTPGIPTPDYDSTPDRSPTGQRKLFTKHRPGLSKHITPPTVENIQRAKSLTALNTIDDDKDKLKGPKSKAIAPNPLRTADSMTDLRINPSRPKEAPPGVPSKLSPGSSNGVTGQSSRSSSLVSSFQPEFFKRHPELDMESFNIDKPKSHDHRPPSSYFDSKQGNSLESPATSLNSFQSQSEPRRFEFLPKPCDPSKLPVKENGEEARIASQDYRGSINSNKLHHIGELPKPKTVKPDIKIRELSEKTARSFGLKKAPAPMPPVLRKYLNIC